MKIKRERLEQCVLHFAGLTVMCLFSALLLVITALAKAGLPFGQYLIGSLCAAAVFTTVSAIVLTLVLVSRGLAMEYRINAAKLSNLRDTYGG